MTNLPGLLYDTKFVQETEFLILFHKTFRCYYISLFYLANKKYKEASGFFFRVEGYVRRVESALNAVTDKNQQSEFKKELDILVKDLNQSKYKIQTAAILESELVENEEAQAFKNKLDKIVSLTHLFLVIGFC